MKIAIYCIAVTAWVLVLIAWMMTQIHYRIGSRHLKVMLFGVPLRKIPLEQIVGASKRDPKHFAEWWPNCFKRSHRVLTLELNKGLQKSFVITPRHRYVFLGDLKAAIRRIDPESEFAKAETQENTTTLLRRDAQLAADARKGEDPGTQVA